MARQRLMKRYELPEECHRDCEVVVMRELSGQDEIEAAIMADRNATSAVKESAFASVAADQREALRLSLVMVDGRRVNHDGVPFRELDDFSMATIGQLLAYFRDLNGVPSEKSRRSVAEGKPVTLAELEAEAAKGAPSAASSDG